MQSASLHILLIEDDLTDALMLQHQLEEDRMNAFTITSAESLADGLALLACHKFDAVLLDLSLPDGRGMEVFQRMLAQAPNLPIVVCASHRQEEEAIQAVRNGAQDYLIKSLKGFDLTARTIRHAVDRGFAQRKIRASEKHWRALLEQSNDAIVMLGADGEILYESPAAFHILGYAPGEMAGKHWNEFIYAEDRAMVEQDFVHVMANPGQPVQSQARFIRKDGSICWIEATSTNWLHDDDLHATIINYRDITVRKQADEKLRQSEERFRLAFENASIGMCLVSLEGILLQVNTRMADMFGYSPAELAGMSVNALAVPEDAALSTSFIEQAIQDYQNVAAFEKRYHHKQGHVIYGLVSSSLVRDTTSQPLYFISQVMDITERKQSEALSYAQHDLAQAIGRINSLEEGFRLCLETALNLSGMDSGGIYLFDAEYRKLELFHHHGLGQNFINEVSRYLSDTPNVQMILTGNAYYFSLDDAFLQNKIQQQEGLRTLLVVPIQYQNRVIGSLNLASHTLNEVPEYARHALETLAVEIGNFVVYLRAQVALRESEEKYRSLVEASDAIIVLLDDQGRFHYINEKAAAAQGLDVSNVLGNTLHDMLDQPTADLYLESSQKVISTNRGMVLEAPTGRRFYRTSIQPVRDEQGRAFMALLSATDITELEKTERSLQNRNAEMSLLLEAGRALSETLDRHQIYTLIYDYITRVVPCDILIISSFDPHTELLTCEYLHTGDSPQDVSGFPSIPLEPPGRGAQSQVIRSGISMLMPDFEAATRTAANNYYFDEQAQIIDDVPDDAERTRSAIIVPLRVEGQVTGAMQVLSVHLNAHTEEHLRFVETLAFRISAALSNAQLFAELEQRVAERTAEVRDLYDNAPTGYHSLDSNGKFIVINQTELNWLGYAREQVIGRSFENFITEPSIAIFREAFPVFKQRGWQRDLEFEMVRRDGSTFWALINATAIYDQDGNYLNSRSTVFDHTQRKHAEIALRESEQQSRLLFEESPDAMILLDQHGQIVQMNHVCEILTGMPSAQFVRHLLKDTGLLPDDLYQSLVDLVSQSFHGPEEVVTFEIKLQHLGGELRDISARVFALNLHGNRHYLASLRDVTVSRRAAEALHYANAEMERAMKLKDEFLANMSHELRTPLHGILALSESLLEQIRGPLNERQQKSLRAVESSGKHLLSLINDLLDLSKIEAGKIELLIEMVLVEDICQSSLSFIQEMASKKRIRILYDNNQPAAKVQADARRLKQMLVNLLSNAVKFTPESGHVDLTVRVVPEEQAIRFEIQDTGPGILPADQSKLFQPFTQLDSRLARQFEGTGLGLVLVKRLANQHGGTVHVESEGVPGQGSCFILSLPYNIEKIAPPEQHLAAPAAPVAIPIQHAGVQVLLVEDNNVNIEVVNDYLEYAGYQVIVARTGIEALDLAATNAPAMILMDIQIPDIDGLEVTRRLRAQPRYANTPIIALTASAMTGDRERCLQAGATEYMSKPLRMKELLEMIERLLK